MTRADMEPDVIPVTQISLAECARINRRVKELVGHMRRLAMPHRQLEEDVGALLRFARTKIREEIDG